MEGIPSDILETISRDNIGQFMRIPVDTNTIMQVIGESLSSTSASFIAFATGQIRADLQLCNQRRTLLLLRIEVATSCHRLFRPRLSSVDHSVSTGLDTVALARHTSILLHWLCSITHGALLIQLIFKGWLGPSQEPSVLEARSAYAGRRLCNFYCNHEWRFKLGRKPRGPAYILGSYRMVNAPCQG